MKILKIIMWFFVFGAFSVAAGHAIDHDKPTALIVCAVLLFSYFIIRFLISEKSKKNDIARNEKQAEKENDRRKQHRREELDFELEKAYRFAQLEIDKKAALYELDIHIKLKKKTMGIDVKSDLLGMKKDLSQYQKESFSHLMEMIDKNL